jgi:pimeloyl-ACP methyl ester carboxylesterase
LELIVIMHVIPLRRWKRMPRFATDGLELAYDEVGSGPPILLIHGSFGRRANWAELAGLLAGSARVLMYDRRGHGESGGAPEAGTLLDDAADAAALIEGLVLGPTRVVGSSFGGSVALRLAARRPELVERLVCQEPPFRALLDATPAGREEGARVDSVLASVRELLEGGELEAGVRMMAEQVIMGDGGWDRLPVELRAGMVAAAPTYLGELRDPDADRFSAEEAARVDMPVLVTQGDRSPVVYRLMAEQLAAMLPNAQRRTIEGSGHSPLAGHVERYASILHEFFADLRLPARAASPARVRDLGCR